jgi:hypothetical protein
MFFIIEPSMCCLLALTEDVDIGENTVMSYLHNYLT